MLQYFPKSTRASVKDGKIEILGCSIGNIEREITTLCLSANGLLSSGIERKLFPPIITTFFFVPVVLSLKNIISFLLYHGIDEFLDIPPFESHVTIMSNLGKDILMRYSFV